MQGFYAEENLPSPDKDIFDDMDIQAIKSFVIEKQFDKCDTSEAFSVLYDKIEKQVNELDINFLIPIYREMYS